MALCIAAAAGGARANPIRVPSDGTLAFEVEAPPDVQARADGPTCLALTDTADGSVMKLCMMGLSDRPDASVDEIGATLLSGVGGVARSRSESVDHHQGREFESAPLPNGDQMMLLVVKLNREAAFLAFRLQRADSVGALNIGTELVLYDVRLIAPP